MTSAPSDNVIRLPLRNCVEISQGISMDAAHEGRTIFIVDYRDDEGGVLTDYVGEDYEKARACASGWAEDTGGRVVDHVALAALLDEPVH